MEEADSLLGLLTSRGEGNISETYCKHPKDERTTMEELREVNAQLRCLVRQLVAQLEASRAEVESLRSRLRLYEPPSLPELAPLDLPNFDYSATL